MTDAIDADLSASASFCFKVSYLETAFMAQDLKLSLLSQISALSQVVV